jgi:hypothetical protein
VGKGVNELDAATQAQVNADMAEAQVAAQLDASLEAFNGSMGGPQGSGAPGPAG